MSTVQPEGESLRKAVKWISDERTFDGKKSDKQLIDEACLKFNLSPRDAEYLSTFMSNKS